MNNKKVNWLYLCIILANYALMLLIWVFVFQGIALNIGIVGNLFMAQAIMLVPALIFAITSYMKSGAASFNEFLGFHKIKISTFFMVILFTFLLMPMTSAINAISMLFVDNAVESISGDVLQMPFLVMLFMIAIFGPFSEEFVFRGIIFRGYKNSGSVLQAVIWSAVLFGVMHLNFNQAAYAVAMGFMCALVVEASGSLWASVVAHMVFNAPSVFTMYLSDFFQSGTSDGSVEEALTNEDLIAMIGPALFMAVIATSLAVCVLIWIAKNENRSEHFKNIWARRKENKGRIISIPLIIAFILALFYMTGGFTFVMQLIYMWFIF
ncbi:MAG: CPBP family intramembrane metalloprotease [Lachnospiraceae bacterium]|nr:CPBP family intramembrane metalloprotease [Lachnospiraceae bacterium]